MCYPILFISACMLHIMVSFVLPIMVSEYNYLHRKGMSKRCFFFATCLRHIYDIHV